MKRMAESAINWQVEAQKLQRQVDDLEFQLENLQSALADRGIPKIDKLTETQARIGQLLRHRSPHVVTKTAIYNAIYADRHEGELPELKTVGVFVCLLRANLRPHDIEIVTAWGAGFFMPADSARAWDIAAGKDPA